MLVMLRLIHFNAARYQLHRVPFIDDVRSGFLAQLGYDAGQVVGYSLSVRQNADELALVIGYRKLTERAGSPANDDDDVGRVNVVDLTAHETAACVDDNVECFN